VAYNKVFKTNLLRFCPNLLEKERTVRVGLGPKGLEVILEMLVVKNRHTIHPIPRPFGRDWIFLFR
jgi:hypothetical protein